MRFRQNFNWPQIAFAAVWAVLGCLWFIRRPTHAIGRAYLFVAVLWLFVGLRNIAMHLFIWCEIRESSLHLHRMRESRDIPWSEITHVGPWLIGTKPNLDYIQIDYYRPAPMSDRGNFIFRPNKGDRSSLLNQLRTRAPKATFET